MSDERAAVLVASNRGPVSFSTGEDGALHARRGGGGLVSGLSAIGGDTQALWVCAALSDADREAVSESPPRRLDPAYDVGALPVRMLSIPPDMLAAAYNGIANSTLWFLHHMLYDGTNQPVFDAAWHDRFTSYAQYNWEFAHALSQEAAEGAAVLVQDYHLTLAPRMLRGMRPDLRIGHFSHTPWAPPDYFRRLPDNVAGNILLGVLSADRVGFLTARWARAFADCCRELLGATVRDAAPGSGDLLIVERGGRSVRVGVHGLGADPEFLRERAYRPDVDERRAALREAVGAGRRMIVRVDRTELSKNIVRGLLAYRELLAERPEWRGRVVHVAFAYPSRTDLAEYRAYTEEVRRTAEAVNEEFGTDDWRPVLLHVEDDFPRSLAAYRLADVALVNPIRDGMNLVAKEVPVVSEEGCALVLSREAGAFEELGGDAVAVNPFDVSGTALALHEALSMDDAERAERSKRLAAAAVAGAPQRWFAEQLDALRG